MFSSIRQTLNPGHVHLASSLSGDCMQLMCLFRFAKSRPINIHWKAYLLIHREILAKHIDDNMQYWFE